MQNTTTPNPMYAVIDEALGKTTPTFSGAPVQSRADEIRSIAKEAMAKRSVDNVDPNMIKVGGVDVLGGAAGGFLKSAGNDISKAGSDVHDAIVGEGNYAGDNPVTRGVEATATAFGAVPKVASELLPGFAKNAIGEVGKTAGNIIDWLGDKLGSTKLAQDFVAKHPDAAKTLEQTAKTTGALGEISGTILASDAGAKIASKTTELGGNSIDKTVNTVNDTAKSIKEKISPSQSPDEIAGQIAQGKIADITPFKEGIKDIDTEGVKTYSDLNKASSDKIKELAKAQDEILDKDTTKRPIQSFEKTVGEGDSAVKINYVDQALNHLKELYTSTSDAEGLTKINDIISKEKTGGLTLKEVNNIAREYGSEFKQKAFSKTTGDPLTSVNATKYENIRNGLKNTVRENLTDEVSKNLDKKMTNLYTVKSLTEKMAEKVNTLEQRLQKPNVLQKVGGMLGKVGKITGVKDFAQKLLGLDKIPGAKTLDAIELESKLAKNLKKINEALAKDDDGFANDVSLLVRSQ